ncbi:hypothetical protein M408DRAFT_325917 [Serendipita vermifera MAFF 305830]|uniref:Sodium/calcium exchanger membrane region domain-containing protein n=1 Tax=Serendipita vermifera MAFF 305830 TaxID=933852 RepID=A0A0C2X938_SERVB|nr:hypothetical protein M408DRAFT_325917 [Serendipita vermifera MAFF 305830]
MSNTKTAEPGLGSHRASQYLPRISVEGPDDRPSGADAGKFNNKATTNEERTPGMLEADTENNGRNLKKRNITANGANGAPDTTPATVGLKRTPTEDVSWLHALLHPKHNPEKLQAPPIGQSLMNIVKYSWLNVLLLFIPVSWGLHFSGQGDTIVFVFSFLSIIPLAALLGYATEEMALRTGPTLGGLLNATFGNAVELIIAIIALIKNELRIVQASMLGSFLSNCLLVLGMCFFAGGIRFHEQSYGERIAQQQIALLSLCVFSIVVPTAFVKSGAANTDTNAAVAISRGTAVMLLICYAGYLFFQLHTHKYLYTLEASKLNAKGAFETGDLQGGIIGPEKGQRVFRVPSVFRKSIDKQRGEGTTEGDLEDGQARSASPFINENDARTNGVYKKTDGDVTEQVKEEKEEEEEEEPTLKMWIAILLLVVVTVLTGVTAEFLVSSIDGMTTKSGVNKEFVALILLPLVGNAAEHTTAVTVSVKNKLDLALGVAIGSSIQIFLFVLPFLVCLAWGLNKDLTLNFDVFETVIVTLAIVVVSYAIADGRTNWLEGLVLMTLYVIIAIATWFHQADGLEKSVA